MALSIVDLLKNGRGKPKMNNPIPPPVEKFCFRKEIKYKDYLIKQEVIKKEDNTFLIKSEIWIFSLKEIGGLINVRGVANVLSENLMKEIFSEVRDCKEFIDKISDVNDWKGILLGIGFHQIKI